jgi:hypothetical protein
VEEMMKVLQEKEDIIKKTEDELKDYLELFNQTQEQLEDTKAHLKVSLIVCITRIFFRWISRNIKRCWLILWISLKA